jgi:hypothetical protein
MLVCFLVFHRLTRKHLVILTDMLLGLCNPPHRGCGEPAKPRLLYPLMWIPCCGIVFAGVVKQSRLLNK